MAGFQAVTDICKTSANLVRFFGELGEVFWERLITR